MTTDYMQVDTEVLGQMMRVAKQNPALPQEQLEALRRAVEERKKELRDRLTQPKDESDNELNILKKLIILEPDNYAYYERAGKCAQFMDDYPTSVAYYTSALQLVGDDVEKLGELYKERSRSYLRHKDYANAFADGKLYLRFKYLSPKYDDSWRQQKSYNLYLICESLRQLGNQVLGDLIENTYELAELSEEGVTDDLIEDYCRLLDIPLESQMTTSSPRTPFLRFNELKQQLPSEPREVKKWQLRKQFYEEYQNRAQPDYFLLVRIMQELISLEPTNYRYYATLGGLHFKQRKYETATPHLTQALQLVDQYPGDPWWQQTTRKEHLFRLHRMLGRAYFQVRNNQAAARHYEMGIRAYPECDETTEMMALLIYNQLRWHFGPHVSAMGEYFRQTFPGQDNLALAKDEDRWEEWVRDVFVEFSKVGTELGRLEQVHRQTMETLDRLTTAQEKTDKAQQQAQKAAETVKHLEELLRLSRIRS